MANFTKTPTATVPVGATVVKNYPGIATDWRTSIIERLKTILFGFDTGEVDAASIGLTPAYILKLQAQLITSVLPASFSTYINGCKITYKSANIITLEKGEVVISDLAHTIPAAFDVTVTGTDLTVAGITVA